MPFRHLMNEILPDKKREKYTTESSFENNKAINTTHESTGIR